jgi:ribosomal-protein-alanine N-acetyltransferase
MKIELTSLLPHATTKFLKSSDWQQFIELEELIAFQQSGIPSDHAAPRWTCEEFQEYLNRGEIAIGIFDKQKMFAFYIFCVMADELCISEIGVHPDYRGRGFGRCIVKLLEQEAKTRGLRKCTLTVDPFNEVAIRLYLRCGYQITAYKVAYFGAAYPNTDRFWMEHIFENTKEFGKERLKIRVDEAKALKLAFGNGFTGTELISSLERNSRHNFVVLRK